VLRGAQILMVEGRCHAVYFGFVQTMPCGFGAPLRDSLADVFCYVARPPSVQFEISRYLYRQRERGRVSSSLIAVLRMRGLMSVGTGLRS